MKGYNVINLHHLVEELGEDSVNAILLNFSCPINRDVETFIRNKAIEFSKQGLARTYIVSTSYRKKQVVIGYFTLAYKSLHVAKNRLTQSWTKRLAKFGNYDKGLKKYSVPAPLIAQLSKNYTNSYNQLISGDELLSLSLERLAAVQMIIGGRIIFLECQDVERLLEFYKRNGFIEFGKRPLDKDELDLIPGEYLIQMVRYLR